MSDSLRDQLLQAGFADTSPKKTSRTAPKSKGSGNGASKRRSNSNGRNQQRQQSQHQADLKAAQAEQEAAAIAQRKESKAKIKSLIEQSRIKDFKGESAHRFIVGTRIRELHVTDAIREKLNDGSYVITRLSGNTEIVPSDTATAIEAINPDWAVIRPNAQAGEDDDYKDFQVPDDLQW